MDKRYQVFVSSTYADLLVERQEVMHALLELDCIPSGMELFPAANQSQWEFIKRVITDCDYYIVIIGGRYGSLGPSGKSYTEMEFDFATEIGKPTIAFLHRKPGTIPAEKTESSDEGRQKLKNFRATLENKLRKEWESPQELGSVVSRSLVQLMKSEPGVGWVRSNEVSDLAEINRFRKRIDDLERELALISTAAPQGTEKLAQGGDLYTLWFDFNLKDDRKPWGEQTLSKGRAEIVLDWDCLANICLPAFQQEGSESDAKLALERHIRSEKLVLLATAENVKANDMYVDVNRSNFDDIVIQFRALGYITESIKKRHVKDSKNYWKLTPFGTLNLIRLRAKRK